MSSWSRTSLARLVCIAGAVLLQSSSARAADSLRQGLWDALCGNTPHQTAVGLYGGTAYDWSHMSFCMVSLQQLYDYDAIWPHRAPDGLGMRFEADIGAATGTQFSGQRLIASGNFMAVYEFGSPKKSQIVPYIEGGVGLIYTDFRRQDQGFRLNFNPVMGAGLRMGSKFVVLRLHHLSNGGLDDENRGINSVVLGFGVYLGPD
jgi:lipid A 3-O-deacylase